MVLGRSKQTFLNTNKFDEIDYNISIESCGYVDMFVEATEELAALESAVYVADVMLEEQVLEGATNVEVLLEGVISSVFTRLKEAVQKLWAKIKQWFANVKQYFKILFTHGKDFAKKYKTEIIRAEANCHGFKYEFYPVKHVAELLDPTDFEKSGDYIKVAKDLLKNGSDKSNAELAKQHMQDEYWLNGVDTQADQLKKARETFLGGESKEEFEDFKTGPSVKDMLNLLENGEKFIQAMDKEEREIGKACTNMISEIQKKENEAAKGIAENGGKLDRAYALAVEVLKTECNYGVAVCSLAKDIIKTLVKDSESVLKRLLSHKPKKEGFEGVGFHSDESLLESALKLI